MEEEKGGQEVVGVAEEEDPGKGEHLIIFHFTAKS